LLFLDNIFGHRLQGGVVGLGYGPGQRN
jgi:hypothetical protein